MIRALISSIVLWGIIVDRELYQKNKQIVFSSILIRAKWIRQRRVCHFWRHSSRDQEDTRNFNYNLELLEESPSKHIYIYTSYKHPLWYIWIKSNRGMKGAFPAQGIVTQKNARLRSRIPSMPLANYSPLHSSKSSTFLDTRCDPRRIEIPRDDSQSHDFSIVLGKKKKDRSWNWCRSIFAILSSRWN